MNKSDKTDRNIPLVLFLFFILLKYICVYACMCVCEREGG